MPDWTPLRRRAYNQHCRLRALCAECDLPLLPADVLLHAAAEDTGMTLQPLPVHDPLLAGAQAFLDRDSEVVWYGQGQEFSTARQRFACAHEFAHYWLHPSLQSDLCALDDSPQTYMAGLVSSATQLEEGYSPEERREREANIYAAELLLPAPLLYKMFVDYGWRSEQIAAYTGLSESCVLVQMSQALLLPSYVETDTGGQTSPLPHLEEESGKSGNRGAATGAFRLDSSQERAAKIASGPVLVDAGPGTGKTRTLVARILHLLAESNIAPENILALTFSNKAAEEMKTRLREVVGDQADRVWIGTFHAFGFEILRKDGQQIGLPVRPVLLEPADAITLLERQFDRLNLREFEYLHDPSIPFPDILGCISRAKDELKTPEDYLAAAQELSAGAASEEDRVAAAKAEEVAHVYAVYQEVLEMTGRVDYGDLILRAVELLEHCPDVRARWQAQYPHILADEYQDINRASARLLQCLAGAGKGFWAVGDLRQAIYRFRGASPANIRQFEQDFPGGERLSLEVNYRSHPNLVRLFGGFAELINSGNAPAEFLGWNASRPETPELTVTVATADDEEAQADWLAAQIRGWEAAGVQKRDQAILTPTNRHAAQLADSLEARGIAVQHLGGLFERSEVKDLLSLLSLACEPEGTALARVAKFPEVNIPRDDVKQIIEGANRAKRPFPGALTWAAKTLEVSEQGRRGVQRLRETLLPIAFRGDAWLLLARYLFQTSRYLLPLLTEESIKAQQQRLAIYQLLQAVQSVSQRLPLEEGENLQSAFLHRLRRILQTRQARSLRPPDEMDSLDGVRLMTVHQAKGLEFRVVYLPNLVKGQFPSRGRGKMASLPPGLTESEDEEATNEECLFFVALSRARDHLVLSRPVAWNGKLAPASPLLEKIEGQLTASGALRVDASRAVNDLSDTGQSDDPGSPATLSIESSDNDSGMGQNPQREDSRPEDRPNVSLSAIKQYRRCPRQYYYQRVLGLPERGAESVYRTFHKHLQDTLHWLQTERTEGRGPTITDVQREFGTRWPQEPLETETAQGRVLRKRALSLLDQAHTHLVQSGSATSNRELTAELEHGAIRLHSDQAEDLADGTLRLTQHLHRPPKKDDHTDEPLALLRHAARRQNEDRPVQIALFSTANGETREVKEDKRWEPKRIEKFEIALEDLRAGKFPPRPSETECPICPFFFICPE